MKTRGGADIVMQPDGSVHHAGNSRWKATGAAGAVGVLALAKFPFVAFALLRGILIFRLFNPSGFGAPTFIGVSALVCVFALPLLFRRLRRTF